MKSLRFEVFGRDVLIVEKDGGWEAFYLGNEGKRRLARDISVPSNISESEMIQYLDDYDAFMETESTPEEVAKAMTEKYPDLELSILMAYGAKKWFKK